MQQRIIKDPRKTSHQTKSTFSRLASRTLDTANQ